MNKHPPPQKKERKHNPKSEQTHNNVLTLHPDIVKCLPLDGTAFT